MAHSQFSHFISFLSGKTTREPPYNAELGCSEIFSGVPHEIPVYLAVALVAGVGRQLWEHQHRAAIPISWGTSAFKCHWAYELSEALSISQDQPSDANQLVLQQSLGTFLFPLKAWLEPEPVFSVDLQLLAKLVKFVDGVGTAPLRSELEHKVAKRPGWSRPGFTFQQTHRILNYWLWHLLQG